MWEVLTNFDLAVLGTFVVAGLLLNLTPGVDFVYISTTGAIGGPRIGAAAAIGVNLGVLVHIFAAVAGVSALLIAYPAAYDAIRYCGAAYLLYLAYRAWMADSTLPLGAAAQNLNAAIGRGFLTNVLNPKTALFIFAFIPQFTDPAIGPMWMQILILGAIFFFNGFLFALTLGVSAGWLARKIRTQSGALNKLTAILFGGLAARLILE